MPDTARILLNVFDGTRAPISSDTNLLVTISDGNQKQVERNYHKGPSIGFEVDAEIELVRRQGLEIQRTVLVRGAVHRAAVGEDQHEVLAGADVLGSLEHHVFEQVGEAGAARPLVLRADVVPEVDRDERQPAVDVENDTQAVGERGLVQRQSGVARHGRRSIRESTGRGKRAD